MILRDYQIKSLKHFRKYLRMRKIFKIIGGNPEIFEFLKND
jgi:hypothetical protein